MIELLAQAATDPASRAFGLTIPEWVMLLGALATFLEAMRQRHGKLREGKKVQAISESLEEVQDAHPEAIRLAKTLTRDKAAKLGVEVRSFGLDGLSDDVKKHTKRYDKGALAFLFAACLLSLGCISPAALKQCKDQIGFNTNHWNNASLPMESRLIGAKNADAWAAQLYNLDGTKLPDDVVHRLKKAGRLPEDYVE